MKTNTIHQLRANSWFTHPVRKFLSAIAVPALFCASTAMAQQAAYTLYSGHNGSTLNGGAYWSTTSSLTPPLVNWTNGDYAYFGVPALVMPGNITWGSLDTPGLTLNGQGVNTTVTIHGSTLKMDSDPNNHPGYMTMDLVQNAIVFGQQSAAVFYKPNTAATGVLAGNIGLYLGGDGTGEAYFGDTVGGLSGNLWIGEGGAVIMTLATWFSGSSSIILGDNAAVANGQYAIIRASKATLNPWNITQPVIFQGNCELDNGAGDGPLAFAGGVYLAGQNNVACNANTVSFNSTISGPGGLNFVPCPINGAGWGAMSLNAANTYSGGTTLSVDSTLTVGASGTLGSGPVTLNLVPGSGLNDGNASAMSPNATLNINVGYANGFQVNLAYAGNQNISALVINGTSVGPGVYGTANNPLGVFAGGGTITVANSPYPNPIIITSQQITGGQFNVCWSSVAQVAYNVYTNIGLVSPSWSPVNAAPIPSQGSTTCYTLPGTVSGQSQVYVTIQQQ